jgi:hypothetical protein
VEISCPACGRTLRVADEHAAKQIRCPACQQISITPGMAENSATPGADQASAALETDRSATSWHVRTPDGPVYGPIDWTQVLAWAAEGRIAADCELAESGQGPWRPAAELVSNLPARGPEAAARGPAELETPYSHPPGGHVAPHRGILVLVMGILGFMSCPLFSIVAWVIGSRDLWEMRAGRMDRSGEGLTLAGMILGIFVSVGWILVALAVSVMVLIYVSARL